MIPFIHFPKHAKSDRTAPRTIVGLCLPFILASGALAEAENGAVGGKKISDSDITTAIQDALFFESAVRSKSVDVSVKDGVVSLDGNVGDLRARDRAVKLAESIRGVRAVIDRIDVKRSDRSDEDVAQAVRDLLLIDPATDMMQIDVSVVGGKVVLSGSVDSWQESRLAEHVARGVRGVTGVTNKLGINTAADRPDQEIAAEIRRVNEIDVRVDAPGLTVAVDDGEVTLAGFVGSLVEKNYAVGNAWVSGVKDVDASGVEIRSWTKDPMRRDVARPALSDNEIKEAVEDAFDRDPRVFSFEVTAEVDNGKVTLRGEVDNLKAKHAAAADARHTAGVVSVYDQTRVVFARDVDDDQLVKWVNQGLRWNVVTDSADIAVTADDGEITLSGMVDSNYEKSEAEDVVQRTNGVKAVANNLMVDFPTLTYFDYEYDPYLNYDPYYYDADLVKRHRSDEEIRESIVSEIFWSPFVDSDTVAVSVEDGVATLRGSVEDWSEYRSATENAREGGAVEVVNKLDVTSR